MKASREVTRIMHGTARAESDMESRHKWTVEEETALKMLFAEQIEYRTISLAEVRSISQEDPLLSKLQVMVIRNKIRSLFKAEVPLKLPTAGADLGFFVTGLQYPHKCRGVRGHPTPEIFLNLGPGNDISCVLTAFCCLV